MYKLLLLKSAVAMLTFTYSSYASDTIENEADLNDKYILKTSFNELMTKEILKNHQRAIMEQELTDKMTKEILENHQRAIMEQELTDKMTRETLENNQRAIMEQEEVDKTIKRISEMLKNNQK